MLANDGELSPVTPSKPLMQKARRMVAKEHHPRAESPNGTEKPLLVRPKVRPQAVGRPPRPVSRPTHPRDNQRMHRKAEASQRVKAEEKAETN